MTHVEVLTVTLLLLLLIAAVALCASVYARYAGLSRDLDVLAEDMHMTESAANIGYFRRSPNSHIIKWSAGTFAIFGQDPDTFIPTSDSMREFILPEYWPTFDRLSDPESVGRKGTEVEVRFRHPSGRIGDLRIIVRYRFDRRERFTGLFGAVVDITARKAHERATVEREAELKRAISVTGAATWSIDIATGTFTPTPRFAEILGLDPLKVGVTRELHDRLCHPEDLARFTEALETQIAGGSGYNLEYRMRHALGHYIWIHSLGGLIADEAGRPSRIVGTALDVTQRRVAGDELIRSRDALQLAIDASQAGHFDLDTLAGTAYWSPRALEILGRDPSSPPTPATLPTLVHPDDLVEFLAEREEFRIHRRPLDIELRMRHGDGQYIWVHLRAISQTEGAGPTGRVIGLIRDISQRRRSENAVIESEKKYRDLIDGSIQAILIIDMHKPVFCNRACAKLFGYDSPEDLVAQGSILRHMDGDTQQNHAEIWAVLMRGELDGLVRRRQLVNLQGRLKHVEVVGRRVQWDGRPAWQVTMFDVTERDRMEQDLRDSEERFRLLATSASDVIVVYDQANIVTYASPSLAVVSGYAPGQVVGRTGLELVYPDDLPTLIQRRQEIRAGLRKASEPLRWRLRRKDGSMRWIETTNALLPAKDGQSQEMVSASRDITDRVERELELSAAHDRLEVQADDLLNLAQSLEAERERAEQANAAKSQFLAMMSHELRTPMTGVLGMADLLRMTDLNDEQRDLTQLLTRSARMLLDLLNDILDFSKIEAGQLQIENMPLSVSSAVADVQNIFAPVAAEKGLNFTCRLPASYHDWMIGDPKRLRQILANLVNNAIKFTEKGAIEIVVDQQSDGDNLALTFSVSDTGIGIAPENMKRLFSPFIQADVSTSRKFGGTGLGLAICKRLVQAMNGTIRVESTPGEGSCFVFSLSAQRAEAPDEKSALTLSDIAASSPFQPRRILLAEDNETSRYLITTVLQRHGHKVEAVENGALALEAATRQDFDIVLMDMQMPVMDGPEATQNIRKLPGARGRIPIIALTADVIADHRKAYMRAGVNAVVGKPVNWLELEREIERHLSQSAGTVAKNVTVTQTTDTDTEVEALIDDAAVGILVDSIGAEIFVPMIDSFTANMLQYRVDLAAAVAQSDLKSAKRVAHALKGLCAQFGAPRVATLARFIEDQAKDFQEVAPLLPLVDAAVDATQAAFAERKQALEIKRAS